jgi:hypothetical protein
VKCDALLNLSGDAFRRNAVRRIEGVVVAISAAAGTGCAVTVGAGKAGINGYFLHPASEGAFKVFVVTVVTFVAGKVHGQSAGVEPVKIHQYPEKD